MEVKDSYTFGILGSYSHSFEVLSAARELGERITFFEPSTEMRFAESSIITKLFNTYDLRLLDDLVSYFRSNKIPIALMQSDDALLPVYFFLNRSLGHTNDFSLEALECSMNKRAMREALIHAGLSQIAYCEINDDSQLEKSHIGFPLIAKSSSGQGGKGYQICYSQQELSKAYRSVKNNFSSSRVILEEYIDGHQYNVDGIVQNGEVYIYGIQEENYEEYLPEVKRSWFLFNPNLDESTEQRLLSTVQKALQACDIRKGAFHCELRINKNRCVVIDISNRMGEDFCKMNYESTGRDQARDYVRSMYDLPLKYSSQAKDSKVLRVCLYKSDPRFRRQIQILEEKKEVGGNVVLYGHYSDHLEYGFYEEVEFNLNKILDLLFDPPDKKNYSLNQENARSNI